MISIVCKYRIFELKSNLVLDTGDSFYGSTHRAAITSSGDRYEVGQITQWTKEKAQKDKQRSTKHYVHKKLTVEQHEPH